MVNSLNKKLRILVAILGICFVFIFLSYPKTDCQACSLEFNNVTYDGYEAFEFYKDACLTQSKEFKDIYINIDCINSTYENGKQNIYINESCVQG